MALKDDGKLQSNEERKALGLPPLTTAIRDEGGKIQLVISWQDGPFENGRNGVTIEELLAHIVERLEAFNGTQYRCRENSLAITAIQSAENWLRRRTEDRRRRGVLGKAEV